MNVNFLKTYKGASHENIFIALKLKINEGNISQAICVSAIPLSKKTHRPATNPHGGRLYFFIDQDEQNCSLIILATDNNKDVRLKERTYD